jgi:hypothetical protein
MLIHFRLATIPFLGEMILQPSAERLETFWRLAFLDQSFVTSEFIAARLTAKAYWRTRCRKSLRAPERQRAVRFISSGRGRLRGSSKQAASMARLLLPQLRRTVVVAALVTVFVGIRHPILGPVAAFSLPFTKSRRRGVACIWTCPLA